MRSTSVSPEQKQTPGETRIAVAVAVAVAAVAASWSIANHATFGTNVFDSGVIDHALWRVAHGFSDVSTLNGRPLFADHPSGVLLLMLPIYKLAPGMGLPVYFGLRAMSAGLVVWSAWLAARHFDLDRDTRWTLMAVTALGPAMVLVVTAEANTVGLVVGPLALGVIVALRRGSRVWFGVLTAVVAASRPEVALGVIALGLALRRDRPDYARTAMWVGGSFSAVGVVRLFLAGDAPGFSGHLGHLGDSLGEALAVSLRRPWDALAPLFDATPWASLIIWLAAFGFAAPLLSARWMAPTLPLLAIPFLGTWEQADGHIWQYWHLLLPLAMISAAPTLGKGLLDLRRFRLSVAVLVPLMWVVAVIPVGERALPSMSENGRAPSRMVTVIESGNYQSVSAPDPVVPHLTAREEVHRFPAPFGCDDLEVAGYLGPDLLPEAVMLHGDSFEDWSGPLAAYGYENVAEEGIFTLWVTADRPQAPRLECE